MASNLRVDTILPSTGTTLGIGTASGTINFLGNSNIVTSGTLTAASASITGNLGVGGVLTYEDVTNIDSVGVITARSGGYLDIRTGSSINTNATGSAASGTIHKNTNSGEFAVVSGGTGGNNHLTFYTSASAAPTEKLRIGPAGQLGIAGANYGTSGQMLTSQGSGSAVQWASASNPTLSHAFAFMDSQYFTSTITLLAFNPSSTNDKSSGVTIDRTNERFTPTVAGVYLVTGMLQYYHGGGTYTPVFYIYRNGSSYVYTRNIVNYSGGHYDSLNVQAMITFNGSSDYVDLRATHNGGGNATMNSQSNFSMFRVGA